MYFCTEHGFNNEKCWYCDDYQDKRKFSLRDNFIEIIILIFPFLLPFVILNLLLGG